MPSDLSRRRFLLAAAAGTGWLAAGCSAGTPEAAGSQVEGSVVTRWDADPWALGSYSVLPPGTSWRARRVLADAVIADRIGFAGEYCALDFPATVSGAYRSGQRAARRIQTRAGRRPGTAVVVGAGIAGLAAADYLSNAGWQVSVLEARDRIGGRISTDRSLGVPVELGASWIHGVTGSPMVRLVKEAGLTLLPTNYDDAVVANYPSGTPAKGVSAADTALWQALRRAGRRRPPPRASAATRLARLGWRPDTAPEQLAQSSAITLEYGVEASRLGAQALWEGAYYRGGDSLVAGGFDAVPQLLAAPLRITTGTPVRRIDLTGTGVRLATDTGALDADVAIVAVPLPLLQNRLPDVVAMPSAVATAAASLATGNLEKVILAYPKQWWPDRQVLQVLGAPGSRWNEWYPLTEVTGRPVILGLVGGASAWRRPPADDRLVTEAATVLETAFR